jgi:uncharacterized membrane protein
VYLSTEQVRHDDANVREAVRFGALVAVAGIAFLATAAVWMSTCSGATADMLACGVPQRTLLAVGAPAILLLGGLRAFLRTYRNWRKQETWWAWQGAGVFLVALTLVVVTMSPPLVGPVVFGG